MKRSIQPQQEPADTEAHQKTQNQVQFLFAYAVTRGGTYGFPRDGSLVRDHILHVMPAARAVTHALRSTHARQNEVVKSVQKRVHVGHAHDGLENTKTTAISQRSAFKIVFQHVRPQKQKQNNELIKFSCSHYVIPQQQVPLTRTRTAPVTINIIFITVHRQTSSSSSQINLQVSSHAQHHL